MKTNPVFEAAKTFRQAFIDLGRAASYLEFSTNRYGQFSAYFDVAGHGRFRISDHSCNEAFRIDERTVPHTAATAEEAAEIISRDETAKVEAAKEKANQMSQREEYEAPFKARFLAAKQHEQTDIIIEAYPAMRHDKARRREVANRWFS